MNRICAKEKMYPVIYKVKSIGKGFLAVMAKPVSGEWMEDEFRGIANFGIHRIVSLLEVHEAYEIGLQKEKELSEVNEMEFLSYPIPDRGLPHSISSYRKLTEAIHQGIEEGLNTVIHCRAGIGRTGIVSAGVLIQAGFEPDAAFKLISKQRGVEVPDTEEQKQWVITNYQKLIKCT